MYMESMGVEAPSKPDWQQGEYFAARAGSSGRGGPGARAEGAAPASGDGTGAGAEGASPVSGAGTRERQLTPAAGAALRQARAGTQGAATAADDGAPVTTGDTVMDLAAIAVANARREREERPASKPGEDLQEEVEVPSHYCYPYILMAGAWGRSDRCPAEWKYLELSDGPPTRSKNEKGDAVVHEDSTVASKPALDRACPNGDPVSRRKAAAFRAEQEKKAARAEADKANAKRASEEVENKRKRLQVLTAATEGMTGVATSLAKLAAIKEAEQESNKRQTEAEHESNKRQKEAEQESKKRQKNIDALKTKLRLGLGDEATIKQTLLKLLDEDC
ncbi:unnamed protein product [Ectocarpus sp. CCAP 1310/34]|nr:unnamed protein product [Ectocarpus sp. CCAP 1310/34]